MNTLELNDLHVRVLSGILKDVTKWDGCYDDRSYEKKLRITVADNILNALRDQNNVEQDHTIDLRPQIDILESQVDVLNAKVEVMIGYGMLSNGDKIERLESLIGDLTTVMNKHSICGSDDK